MLTSIIAAETSPHGSAKLTLEGLVHWRERLERELAQLTNDIEATEAVESEVPDPTE